MRFQWIAAVSLLALGACKKEEEAKEPCPSLSVVVTVTNPDNEPITDAVVTARRKANPDEKISCTGSDGVYTCVVPDEDSWNIYAEALSYEGQGKEHVLVSPEDCASPAASWAVQLQRESAV